MNQLLTIANKEFKEAWKNRIFGIIAGLFVVFSALSVYIGASTKKAEMMAYNQTIELLKAAGTTAFPAMPQIFPMAILQNNIVYVTMVGALVAIFLGFDAITKEKEHGNIKLILSRPVFRDQVITGKVLGGSMVLGSLQILSLVFELLLLILVGGFIPGPGEIIRLLIFTGISFIYMMLFFIMAISISIFMRSSEIVFLTSITTWIAITFVIPQLANTQRLFAYTTNAASQSIVQIPQDTLVSQFIEVFSPAVHFEHIGKTLLQVIPETATAPITSLLGLLSVDLAFILLPLIVLLIIGYWGFLKIGVEDYA